MVQTDAYSIIKALIEKDLLVIQHQGFVEWLDSLKSKGEIREEEIIDLLQLANQLQIYYGPGSEVVSIEEIPFLEWVQAHKCLIDKYLGYWAVNSTLLGIAIWVTV